MESHHLHSHTHRHVHGGGYRLGPRIPAKAVERPLEMAVRRAAEVASDTLSSRLFGRDDCKANDTSAECEKPVSSSTLAVPIAIAVAVPIVLALCAMVYLHRRTLQRHKREDEDVKYKSMDFGLGEAGEKGNKRKSKLFGSEKEVSRTKGLSMDMNLSSPYLLPPDLQQSRESLHSLARTLHQNEDPYRHVEQFIGKDDATSLRSFAKGTDASSSIYTGKTYSSSGRDSFKSRSTNTVPPRQKSLPTSPLPAIPPTAQGPGRKNTQDSVSSQSAPPAKSGFRFTDDEVTKPEVGGFDYSMEHVSMPQMPEIQEPAPVARKDMPQNFGPISYESSKTDQSYVGGIMGEKDSSALPAPDSYRGTPQGLGIMGAAEPQTATHMSPSAVKTLPISPRPTRKESAPIVSEVPSEYEDYVNHFQYDQQGQDQFVDDGRGRQMDQHAAHVEQDHPYSAGLGVPQQGSKRLSVGLRPLPPVEYLESEDPEFRANRIRSFYKEYFEDGKEPRPPMPQPQAAQYYEDYDAGYMGDAAYFDPESNAFVMPYAQPVTRRAMTPPPNNRRQMTGPGRRGPPGPYGMGSPGPRARAGSTMSAGRFGPASPRPGSSASARMGGRPGSKKPLPPPSALSTLPTPSKLKDDSFALMGATDFAPPPTFRDKTRGRSQSPLGERKPYQLNVPVSSPLVSAFDDIPSLPSPHMMRKSGTFTALDFAPPRRFKDPDSMSDAGSIRSVGSGISTRGQGALRNGAGRVSRLPGDQVFTQAASGDTLKPKWGMRD
ncbi:hypothetical protein BJ170DRAFT_481492 [Xylariales sp. AK1849]|nr:hypothetical protein BJ170DRAFT_481492 [Xylariales sp. AK1849]